MSAQKAGRAVSGSPEDSAEDLAPVDRQQSPSLLALYAPKKPTFSGILKDAYPHPLDLASYRAFLVACYCDEILEFWEECNEYRRDSYQAWNDAKSRSRLSAVHVASLSALGPTDAKPQPGSLHAKFLHQGDSLVPPSPDTETPPGGLKRYFSLSRLGSPSKDPNDAKDAKYAKATKPLQEAQDAKDWKPPLYVLEVEHDKKAALAKPALTNGRASPPVKDGRNSPSLQPPKDGRPSPPVKYPSTPRPSPTIVIPTDGQASPTEPLTSKPSPKSSPASKGSASPLSSSPKTASLLMQAGKKDKKAPATFGPSPRLPVKHAKSPLSSGANSFVLDSLLDPSLPAPPTTDRKPVTFLLKSAAGAQSATQTQPNSKTAARPRSTSVPPPLTIDLTALGFPRTEEHPRKPTSSSESEQPPAANPPPPLLTSDSQSSTSTTSAVSAIIVRASHSSSMNDSASSGTPSSAPFLSIEAQAQLQQKLEYIYQRFLRPGSEREVNLPQSVVKKIEAWIYPGTLLGPSLDHSPDSRSSFTSSSHVVAPWTLAPPVKFPQPPLGMPVSSAAVSLSLTTTIDKELLSLQRALVMGASAKPSTGSSLPLPAPPPPSPSPSGMRLASGSRTGSAKSSQQVVAADRRWTPDLLREAQYMARELMKTNTLRRFLVGALASSAPKDKALVSGLGASISTTTTMTASFGSTGKPAAASAPTRRPSWELTPDTDSYHIPPQPPLLRRPSNASTIQHSYSVAPMLMIPDAFLELGPGFDDDDGGRPGRAEREGPLPYAPFGPFGPPGAGFPVPGAPPNWQEWLAAQGQPGAGGSAGAGGAARPLATPPQTPLTPGFSKTLSGLRGLNGGSMSTVYPMDSPTSPVFDAGYFMDKREVLDASDKSEGSLSRTGTDKTAKTVVPSRPPGGGFKGLFRRVRD